MCKELGLGLGHPFGELSWERRTRDGGGTLYLKIKSLGEIKKDICKSVVRVWGGDQDIRFWNLGGEMKVWGKSGNPIL